MFAGKPYSYHGVRQGPLNTLFEVWCANIAPKRHNLPKTVKIEKKNVKKTLFSWSISNILKFGGNISAPNLKWHV